MLTELLLLIEQIKPSNGEELINMYFIIIILFLPGYLILKYFKIKEKIKNTNIFEDILLSFLLGLFNVLFGLLFAIVITANLAILQSLLGQFNINVVLYDSTKIMIPIMIFSFFIVPLLALRKEIKSFIITILKDLIPKIRSLFILSLKITVSFFMLSILIGVAYAYYTNLKQNFKFYTFIFQLLILIIFGWVTLKIIKRLFRKKKN